MRPVKILQLLALTATASGYVVELWTSTNCSGDPVGAINVWDGSCANSLKVKGVASVKPLHLGTKYHQATFYRSHCCWGLYHTAVTYGGGGDDENFQIGKCISLPFTVNSMGSRWSI